jgi:hypothetical protein
MDNNDFESYNSNKEINNSFVNYVPMPGLWPAKSAPSEGT